MQRGVAGLSTEPRKDSYSAGLDMLFGRKWRGEEPETDYEAQLLLKRYQREDAQPQPQNAAQRTGFALLEPELTPHNGRIWLRLRVSDGIGGRQYLVKASRSFWMRSSGAKASATGNRWPLCTGGMPLLRMRSSCCGCCAVR